MLRKLLSKPDNPEMIVQTWLHNFDFDQQKFKMTPDHLDYTIKPELPDKVQPHSINNNGPLDMSPASPDTNDRLSPGSCDSVLNSPKIEIKTEQFDNYSEYEVSIANYMAQRQGDFNKRIRDHIERPPSTFSNDSGILTLGNGNSSPPNADQIEFELNPNFKVFQPKDELYKMNRLSQIKKQQYVEQQRKLHPIDFSYNPNKSRNLKTYSDASQAEERAKNNFASRRSRYKKKLEAQTKNFSLDFSMMECQQLWEEEKRLSALIRYLENVCTKVGVDKQTMIKMRKSYSL
ncbi:uncharacterized protein LOC113363354 [Ctenocephalides felis]|uniref:uncharacterized protein LOC113363354 n=1 Tax=Ctenocephalides felis TaxID=7515 RepID=UPI000E6E2E95|nr:uncharacterized protein LOC113363354 [Ctenocephalides felis]